MSDARVLASLLGDETGRSAKSDFAPLLLKQASVLFDRNCLS
ncbi:hypothetical protein [Rubritalea tangerina]